MGRGAQFQPARTRQIRRLTRPEIALGADGASEWIAGKSRALDFCEIFAGL